MRSAIAIDMVGLAIIAFSMAACISVGSCKNSGSNRGQLSNEEKHRIYAAALAASDSPLDTQDFKDSCRAIGIIDDKGNPTDDYIVFVSEHVNWSMKPENGQFRREVDSKEKARQYLSQHLGR